MQDPYTATQAVVYSPPATPSRSSVAPRVQSAPAAPLSVWQPIICEFCGKYTSDVFAVAHHLQYRGPSTVAEIGAALGQADRRWAMRATALGRELGLFIRSCRSRGRYTWTVVSTPPPARPPVYPARAILATGASKMPSASTPESTNSVQWSSLASIDNTEIQSIDQSIESELNAEEEKRVREAKARRRRRPKPIPVPKEPSPETAAAVLELAKTWAAACRSAFGRLKWSSALQGEKPWMSPNPKQQRRWRAYYRLWAMLKEHRIEPAEFCVAMAVWGASQRIPRVPNPAVLCGDAGRTRYWMWREQHEQLWSGVADAVRREAQASIADPNTQLAVVLHHAWRQCRRQGTREAISLLWDPEVIWLLQLQEKAAKPVIAELLQQPGSEYAPKMQEALRVIGKDLVRQRRLLTVWTRTIGPRNTLQEYVIPEGVVQRQTLLHALREEGAALRAEERARQHEASVAAQVRSMMASVRRHQARRHAS